MIGVMASPISLLLFTFAIEGGPALASDCAEDVDPSRWTQHLEQAEAAFSSLDEATFDKEMDLAAIELPCLARPLRPDQAARYHRLVGLRLYVRDEEDAAREAFAAARAIEPMGALPSALLPPGHAARALADSATSPGRTDAVLQPKGGELWFDGVPGTERPADRPTVVQLELDGAVATSRYLAPGDAMPPYAAAPLASPVVRRRLALGVGIGLGVGSAALYGAAAASAAQFEGPLSAEDWDRQEVEGLADRTNRLVYASAATGALGGVSIGLALIRW